jgi:phenylalanyl-tRNA synthetase beta chain
MRISYSWLKEFLPELPAADVLAEQLTMHGLEVESVVDQSAGLTSIVVGEVLTVEKHPQADKLNCTTVNVGQEKPLSIICGAPNVVVGMKAPVAMIGTTLPNGMTIERRPIRGIPSEGMMCAEDELGLGTSHEGLLVLPEESRPGQSFVEVLGLDDVVLDLSIPSNRADLLSMRGLAREIGALLGIDVRWPAAPTLKEKPGRSSWKPLIDVGTKSSIFALQAINGITMNPTPSYIVRRLRACGIRSVNIVVDCTNYVMLECGQPGEGVDGCGGSGGRAAGRQHEVRRRCAGCRQPGAVAGRYPRRRVVRAVRAVVVAGHSSSHGLTPKAAAYRSTVPSEACDRPDRVMQRVG